MLLVDVLGALLVEPEDEPPVLDEDEDVDELDVLGVLGVLEPDDELAGVVADDDLRESVR